MAQRRRQHGARLQPHRSPFVESIEVANQPVAGVAACGSFGENTRQLGVSQHGTLGVARTCGEGQVRPGDVGTRTFDEALIPDEEGGLEVAGEKGAARR